MIEVQRTPESSLVEMTVKGFVDRDDLARAADACKRCYQLHRRVALLVAVHKLSGVDAMAWDEATWGAGYLELIQRCAVVGDGWSRRIWMRRVRPHLMAEVRSFDRTECAAARRWLLQGDAAGTRGTHNANDTMASERNGSVR
jgi:hypothetical protein